MKKARLIETNGVAIGINPQTIAAATVDGDWISMKNHGTLALVFNVGAVTGTSTFSLDQALTAAGGSAKALSIVRAWVSGANSDVFTAATISGGEVDLGATDDNKTLVVEVDPNDLDIENLFQYVRPSVENVGGSGIYSCICLCRHPRYTGPVDSQISALT